MSNTRPLRHPDISIAAAAKPVSTSQPATNLFPGEYSFPGVVDPFDPEAGGLPAYRVEPKTATIPTLPSLADEKGPERTPTNPNGWRRRATPTPLTALQPVDPHCLATSPFTDNPDDTLVNLPAFTLRRLPEIDGGEDTGPTLEIPTLDVSKRPTISQEQIHGGRTIESPLPEVGTRPLQPVTRLLPAPVRPTLVVAPIWRKQPSLVTCALLGAGGTATLIMLGTALLHFIR